MRKILERLQAAIVLSLGKLTFEQIYLLPLSSPSDILVSTWMALNKYIVTPVLLLFLLLLLIIIMFDVPVENLVTLRLTMLNVILLPELESHFYIAIKSSMKQNYRG